MLFVISLNLPKSITLPFVTASEHTEEEKIALCKCVSDAKADYIKTSTGFGTGGATLEDVKLLKANVAPYVKVKAAGGMKTKADLFAFLEAGADRLGTSSGIKLLNE